MAPDEVCSGARDGAAGPTAPLVLQLDFPAFCRGGMSSSPVVTESGEVLMVSSPSRPPDDVLALRNRGQHESHQQTPHLRHRQRNQRFLFLRAAADAARRTASAAWASMASVM